MGSDYYATHPLFPLNKTVANINNDLMLPYGPYKDVMITGYGQSELEDYVVKFAEKYDRYVMPDPNPHTGMYYSADHFSFAKQEFLHYLQEETATAENMVKNGL